MIVILASCTLNGGGTTTLEPPTTDDDLGGTPPNVGPDLIVADVNVHSYTAEWVVARTPIHAGEEVFFDWSGLTVDAHGAERAAGSFATLILLRVESDPIALTEALARDELVFAESWEVDVTGQTDARASDLGLAAPWLPESPDPSWLLALADDDGSRLDLRTALLLEPNADAGTFLSFPNGSADYSWLGQIDGEVVRTSAGHPAYTVDWSAVTTDGYGKPFDAALGDELFVGRFEGVEEGDDLGSRLLDLSAAASAWWTLPVGGATSAALADTTGADGPFGGFEADGVYLVGVRCTTCLGPAPLWVTSVDVRAAR